MRISAALIILGVSVAVTGCAQKPLHNLRTNSTGPDEFMVVPVKPLTAPPDYDVLPAPAPGGSNLVDQNPVADAVAALGGRPSALVPGSGVPSSDRALVASTGRYGVPANTRTAMATEDADFRRKQGRLSSFKLFRVDRYSEVYRREVLNAYGANKAFRRAGAETPSAPPDNE